MCLIRCQMGSLGDWFKFPSNLAWHVIFGFFGGVVALAILIVDILILILLLDNLLHNMIHCNLIKEINRSRKIRTSISWTSLLPWTNVLITFQVEPLSGWFKFTPNFSTFNFQFETILSQSQRSKSRFEPFSLVGRPLRWIKGPFVPSSWSK